MKKNLVLCILFGLSITGSSIYAQPTSPALQKVVHNAEMMGSGTNPAPLGLINTCSSTQVLAWNGGSWACAANGATPTEQTTATGSNINDFALTAGVTVLRVNPSANINMTGMTGGSIGRVVVVSNANNGFSVTLRHEQTSTAVNRFFLPNLADSWILVSGASATFVYDSIRTRWVLAGWSSGFLPEVGVAGVFSATVASGAVNITGLLGVSGAAAFTGNVTSNAGSITTLGQVRYGTISPSLTGGATVNDWPPTGLADAYTIFANCPSGICTITGMVGGANGRKITIYNTGAGEIDLPNNNGGSIAANRWNNSTSGGTVVFIANGGCAADFTYSTADSFWHETGFVCSTTTPASSITAGTIPKGVTGGLLTNSLLTDNGTTFSVNGGKFTVTEATGVGSFDSGVSFNAAGAQSSSIGAANSILNAGATAGTISIGTTNTGGITLGQSTNPIALNGPTSISGLGITSSLVTVDSNMTIGAASKNRLITVIDSSQRPTISGCGTGATIVGGDYSFLLTTGTTPGSCVITFQNAISANGGCTLTARDGVSKGYSVSTTALTISSPNASVKYDGSCVSH